MPRRIHRRTWLQTSGALATLALLGPRVSRAAAPPMEVHDLRVISHKPDKYHGWPTLTRRNNGQLLLSYSGNREAHVCPFGQVELMRSDDEGQSWSWPRTLLDSAIDDRDAGVLETAKGTLLVTSFTSLAYEPSLRQMDDWSADRRQRWQAAHRRADAEQRQASLGVWMTRSTDGGLTWSGRYDCLVNSPHGPIQLSDGRLLYAGKDLWREGHRVGVCQSQDDGQSWQWLAQIPVRSGDKHEDYHELHAVEAADGTLITHIRNHNSANARETLQSESRDGGHTWSTPHEIGVWGLPSHLLRLRDGRLLMTYGHRRQPLGNQARLSENNGKSWSEPMLISADGTSGDLGYPSTVELADGSLLTVWYERMKQSPNAVLRQARWTLQ